MGKKEEEEAEEEEEENEGLFLRQKWDRTVSFTSPFAASKPDLVSIDRPATTGGARRLLRGRREK